MKRFWGFVKKEFLHIMRDPRTLLILIGLPVAQLMIFGYVVTNEIKDAKIAIYDKAHDEFSQEISNKILSSGYFVLVKNIRNDAEIEQVFKEGHVREVIIFEPGFTKSLKTEGKADIRLVLDATDANTANLISNYTQAIIYNFAKSNIINATPYQIEVKPRMLYNEELKSVFMFVPGTMALILMLISAMMTSISIAREKELGTMEVLLVSPLKPIQIILGKVAPYVLLAFLDALFIIVISIFVFKMPVRGSLLLLLLATLLYITLALSIGIFISTKASSQHVAMFVSLIVLLLPTMLLSGFMFPIENMPKVLQWLAAAMPPKYYIIMIKNIMIKGVGLAFIWKEGLVLIGMIFFFIILSVKNFKIRLQ